MGTTRVLFMTTGHDIFYLKLTISTVKSTSPTLGVFVPGHLAAHLRAQTLLSALGEFVPGNFFRAISFVSLVLLSII